MVQTYQSPIRVYKYPFELLMAAYERRFPTCTMIPVLLGCDVLEEKESEDGSLLSTKRRCRLAVEAPYLIKKIVGADCIYFIQINTLNRRKRTLTIKAYNESFASRVTVTENCTYSVHPDNSGWTCYEQDASLDIQHFFGFESTVEKIAMKQYSENIQKSKEVIEYYIQELINEGVTYIPPWRDSKQACSALAQVAVSVQNGQSQDSGLVSISSSVCSLKSHSGMMLGATAANSNATYTTTETKTLIESEVDYPGQLNEDYIARFLGQLTPVEQSRLVQLQQWLSTTHKGHIPKLTHLLRFLRAREFNLEKGREMLVHSLAWRKLHDIDRLLQTYSTPDTMAQYYPGGWHHHDKEGRPLYILRLGQMDMKGLMRSVGEEAVLKHVLVKNEEGLNLTAEATKKTGHPVSGCTCLIDLEGLSMRHLWRPGIRALHHIIETMEAHYPETMGRMLILRAPRVFPVLWALVSPFIDENTRRKFIIFCGKDYEGPDGLEQFVDREFVPDFLGGDCPFDIAAGGLVPKTLYKQELMDLSSDSCLPLSTSDLYKKAQIVREFPHEVLIQVAEASSVITWDFDLLKGELTFTVFLSRHPLPDTPLHQHRINGAVVSQQHLPKHYTTGLHITAIEPPTICADGDSVQGSHVTSQAGSYVLQWKYSNSARQSFDFPLTSHKSKVIYHTELLPSRALRGSMCSLQSINSKLSMMSIGSTSQVGDNVNAQPSQSRLTR